MASSKAHIWGSIAPACFVDPRTAGFPLLTRRNTWRKNAEAVEHGHIDVDGATQTQCVHEPSKAAALRGCVDATWSPEYLTHASRAWVQGAAAQRSVTGWHD